MGLKFVCIFFSLAPTKTRWLRHNLKLDYLWLILHQKLDDLWLILHSELDDLWLVLHSKLDDLWFILHSKLDDLWLIVHSKLDDLWLILHSELNDLWLIVHSELNDLWFILNTIWSVTQISSYFSWPINLTPSNQQKKKSKTELWIYPKVADISLKLRKKLTDVRLFWLTQMIADNLKSSKPFSAHV